MLRNLCLFLLITVPFSWAGSPSLKSLVRIEGKAPMALIIGINRYQEPGITPLRGAVSDAEQMSALLTDPQSYGFPADNVILLTDQDATRRNVLKLFKTGLIDRAKAGDPVVFFFSGHGSQGPDLNGDEADGLDEILVLHDTTNLTLGLWDDDLNRLLLQLYRKTKNITVILDACHSESGTRAGAQVRAVKQTLFSQKPKGQKHQAKQTSDGGMGMVSIDRTYKPAQMPEVVVITAAKDGTPSFDGPKGGLFTSKLIPALGRLGPTALTYSQVERELLLALGHTRSQVPEFQGQLQRPVFGMAERKRPITWAVQAIQSIEGKQRVDLLGAVMPGLSVGAVLRVYAQDTSGKDWLDPGKAHGELVVEKLDGLRVLAQAPASSRIETSDLAVLVLPGEDAVRLSFRIRSAGEAEALPELAREKLAEALREDPEATLSLKALTQTDGEAADMELAYRDGALVLLDGLDSERGRFPTSETYWTWNLVKTLIRHARIKAILAMAGDDGELSDHQRLKVEVVAADGQPDVMADYGKKGKVGELLMPKGDRSWYVCVTLTTAKEPMYVAGFALSADGTIFPLPVKGRAVLLKQGESHIFKGQSLRLKLGSTAEDHLVFFASSQRVDWKKFGEDLVSRRDARGPGVENALFQRLNRFLTPGQRTEQSAPMEGDTSFSRTAVRLKAE